jgi:preprotein translocase subunit SecE
LAGVRFSPGLHRFHRVFKMFKFIKESREELKKVVWPSKDEVMNMTIVVLVAVFVISIFLFTVDRGFESIFDALVKLGTGGKSS